MRHKVYGKQLGRTTNERGRLFKNLLRSLILSQTIETTQPKAKAIKGLIDKTINSAKSPQARRFVSNFLSDQEVAEKLFGFLPRLQERSSGYTSVTKIGRRKGDGAMMVKMSLLLSVGEPQITSKPRQLRMKKDIIKPGQHTISKKKKT